MTVTIVGGSRDAADVMSVFSEKHHMLAGLGG